MRGVIFNSVKSQNSKDPGTKNSRVFSFSVGIVCIGNEILTRTLNMGKWAATRMDSLLWEEKLDRIKAFSIRKETRGFIHEECFDTHIELIRAEMPQTVCLFERCFGH